ncbi:MAG: heavy metal resistance protein CzcA [Moraxella osloensis]|nr:heavy metal resistance protein CzcA [Moraxella osloensis]
MTTLANLLHKFNSQTISRSLEYVSRIDLESLERTETAQTTQLQADIKGTKKYHTQIAYHKASQRITQSDCSCPVGSFCKHGAALARLFRDQEDEKTDPMNKFLVQNQEFMQELMQKIAQFDNPTEYHDITDALAKRLNASPITNFNSPNVHNSKQHDEAKLWLKNLNQNLKELDKTKKDSTVASEPSPFVYLIEHKFGQLQLELIKVRRIKSGEIREAKTYAQYSNVYYSYSIPITTKALFTQIYDHVKAQDRATFSQHFMIANELPLELLQRLIKDKILYDKSKWDNDWKIEQFHPITWTDDVLTLEIQWQQNRQQQGEKLEFGLLDSEQHCYGFGQTENFDVLFTQPLTFINRVKSQIGLVNTETIGDMPNDVLYRLLTMPVIPKEMTNDVEEVLSSHQITHKLPKPKNLQPIEKIYGTPQPIIRFGHIDTHQLPYNMRRDYWQQQWIDKQYVKAELSFAYETGEIPARMDAEIPFFTTQKNGKRYQQYRDIKAENKAIRGLKKQCNTFEWLKIGSSVSRHQATIEHNQALSTLLPIDKFYEIGWQVEHLADSPINADLSQNLELLVEPLTGENGDDGNHWFEVGATISDSDGHRYDLLNIVAYLLEQYPYLMHKNIEQLFDKDHLFAINVGQGRPALAVAFKDILPILQNLTHLLSQNERKIDRYDAQQLVDLEHTLGMAWQMPEKLKTFSEKLKAGYQSNLPTPQGFHGELRPYQQQGLAWLQFLAQTEHGGVLADDMGLGKTAQTLAHILMEKQAGQLTHLTERPVLIVAPTSLMHNWQKEAEKFTPELSVLLLHGANRHDDFDKIKQHDIILTTYPLVVRDKELLKTHQFHQIILDEAQNIKNPHSKSAQVLRSLTAKHRLCLTGTPMENHLGELWSLFYFLMPGFLGSQDVFNKHYRHPIEKKADQHKRQKLVNRIKPFMLRRLKTDVAKELPPKTTIEVNIDMNDEQSKLYEAVRATMQDSIKQIIAQQGFKRSQIQILDALLKLRQVCCHPSLLNLDSLPKGKNTVKSKAMHSAKLDYLIETVTDMVAEGRKVLIFSQFTSMLALIEQRLQSENIGFSKLTGKTKKRSEAIEAFQSGQVPVFLISLKAGGVGLNLTTADTVIHYDPWWNPAAEDQASDRAWRIGQDKPVFVYKLITNQSIEEKILDMQKNKAELAQSILSTDHEGDVKLSEEELLGLFEKFV